MDETGTPTHVVVVNAQKRYSLWPADAALPAGWTATGRAGTEAECLDYIDAVWTDLRPRSDRDGGPARDHASS